MSEPGPARQIALDEDAGAIYEHFYEEGWTDGLPVIPPTEERVAETLRYHGLRAPRTSSPMFRPETRPATAEIIAINAVMAGCRPEYLPALIAAVQAMTEPAYNLYGRQTTTHPGAHLMIVHGPVRNELEVNCRQNVFGPGLARQRDARPRGAAPDDERRRRHPRRDGHGHPRASGQIRLHHRRG